MIKDAIEARLSALAELAPLIGRTRKTPRLTVEFTEGMARIEITTDGPGRAGARRLIHTARSALHGQMIEADNRIATPRHIATDYLTKDRQVRAIAAFVVRIETGPEGSPAKANGDEIPAG